MMGCATRRCGNNVTIIFLVVNYGFCWKYSRYFKQSTMIHTGPRGPEITAPYNLLSTAMLHWECIRSRAHKEKASKNIGKSRHTSLGILVFFLIRKHLLAAGYPHPRTLSTTACKSAHDMPPGSTNSCRTLISDKSHILQATQATSNHMPYKHSRILCGARISPICGTNPGPTISDQDSAVPPATPTNLLQHVSAPQIHPKEQ